MPGTGARANELRSTPKKNTHLRPEGWPPTNAPCRHHPFMPRTGAKAKHRARKPQDSLQHTSCRSSPRERMNYDPSARGWPPTNAPCRHHPFMPGTGAKAKHRARKPQDSLQHTSCRSSPRERMNYAPSHNPSARGLASYKYHLHLYARNGCPGE